MTQSRSNRDARGFKSADSLAGRDKMRRSGRGSVPPRIRGFYVREGRVTAVNDETLTVRLQESALVAGVLVHSDVTPVFDFEVARPYEMRRSTYDGKTFPDGFLHTYVSATERTATKAGEDDETHLVTPDWRTAGESLSRVLCVRVSSAAGVVLASSGAAIKWQLMESSRTWVKEPVDP